MCARQQEMSGSQRNYRDLMWSGTSPTSMSRHTVSPSNQLQPDGTYATIQNPHSATYDANSTRFHIEMNEGSVLSLLIISYSQKKLNRRIPMSLLL